MTRTSEYVSIGHPDCVADYIVSHVLDRYLERDPDTRFAMECQIKDNFVTLGGEVTSAATFSGEAMEELVREAVRDIGYTHGYAERWGEGNALDADRVSVTSHIGVQSPDIAQGVDADGWGDQGIMWGMAVADRKTGMMPEDHAIARAIGSTLYSMARSGRLGIGLDIKTQVSMDGERVTQIVVAAPMKDAALREDVRRVAVGVAKSYAPSGVDEGSVVVNGTGAFVRHASQGDCGTTGRKLAVDLYGGNCRIGGGCPWGKDPTKADVTLNVYARKLAADMVARTGLEAVHCAISCCIGRRDIGISFFDGSMREISRRRESRPAKDVIRELGLDAPVFARLKSNGLFSRLPVGLA